MGGTKTAGFVLIWISRFIFFRRRREAWWEGNKEIKNERKKRWRCQDEDLDQPRVWEHLWFPWLRVCFLLAWAFLRLGLSQTELAVSILYGFHQQLQFDLLSKILTINKLNNSFTRSFTIHTTRYSPLFLLAFTNFSIMILLSRFCTCICTSAVPALELWYCLNLFTMDIVRLVNPKDCALW